MRLLAEVTLAFVLFADASAPTDAAFEQTVVSDARLPSRLRQGLNVESGLNDGERVRLLFAAIAAAELSEALRFDGQIILDLFKEVGITLVGAAAAAPVVLRPFEARPASNVSRGSIRLRVCRTTVCLARTND